MCHFKHEDACVAYADESRVSDLPDEECRELVWIDAVNDPEGYNRALRCRCDVNDDFGEDSVLRRERTAVHCKDES